MVFERDWQLKLQLFRKTKKPIFSKKSISKVFTGKPPYTSQVMKSNDPPGT